MMDLSRLGEPDLFEYYASKFTCPRGRDELVLLLLGVILLLLNDAVKKRKHGSKGARPQYLAWVEQKV